VTDHYFATRASLCVY